MSLIIIQEPVLQLLKYSLHMSSMNCRSECMRVYWAEETSNIEERQGDDGCLDFLGRRVSCFVNNAAVGHEPTESGSGG